MGSLDAGINLPLLLRQSIDEDLQVSADFDTFYQKYLARVQNTAHVVMTEIARSQRLRAQYNPVPMRTLLVDDCIDKELEFNKGGARYMWSVINNAGVINVIESLNVIRTLVYEEKL